ncbi:DNA-binding SARP family transcriptional activator/tetratricopeptide (TPR) repeat protein [Kibdelosporangium banguiense]|uniref:DNA-binding SARP family transcriptional activator/tetratricopeptide (TPR) repeat protein n=1 Tax=Kibdelosporangium banguiense TaxID=1365924 RepID=A0ABS4T629_9PSEU|nr:BTAD domain-containing putative transcriptional regulator [Kibdelosporangium banguiense]MBP2319920.1 DNA-binding SARP family transcriptional activator/tetratricopeptide (TPR) repeat protein [Kibdelosporangium banguiense]
MPVELPGGRLDFRILGPLEVCADGQRVHVGSRRQRALLAMLLLRANKFVAFDDLVEVIWGDSTPVHPRAAVHTCVTRLRNALDGVVIEGGADGYRIVLDEQAVDLCRFDSALAAARAAGDREAEVLGQALSLWRGEPLAGVASDYLQRHEVSRLTELRLRVLERKLELDLAAGGHDVVVPQLQVLTAEHPLRERFWALLVTALYRCGRQADALAAYATVRQHLVDELGVEPGQELRQAHQRVLAGEEASGWQVECQLPIDVSDFTNRDDELSQVIEVLRPGDGVPIVAVTGPPGMGKSALAVRAAHRLIADYPDGQWFLRLDGAGAARDPGNLLTEALRNAGVDRAAVPDRVDERSTLLRSRLAGRKVLLVLDDAGSAEQVAPLLPGRPGSAVLVTSRSDLVGLSALYGANRLSLQPLSARHARDLVARIAGSERCEQDEAASVELTELCGRLPLALRIAAANLASRPGLRISHYAADLRTGDRLGKLSTRGDSGIAVRAAFDVSFAALWQTDQRAFSLLGVVPGADFSSAGAAALFGCPIEDAVGILDRLVAANLLESPGTDRFRFHDLIRVYAADRAQEYDSAEAFERLAEWYLHTTHAAVTKSVATLYISRLGPPPGIVPLVFQDDDVAVSWLETERLNYLAVIEYAAVHGPVRFTWQLTDAARPDLQHQYHQAELEHAAELGLSCARTTGDRRGEAMMLLALGALKAITARFDGSVTDLKECRRIAVELSETGIQATALLSLATALGAWGFPLESASAAEEGLELVENGAEQGEGRRLAALHILGNAYVDMGRIAETVRSLRAAIQQLPDTAPMMSRMVIHIDLGRALREAGEYDEAIVHFQSVLTSAMAPLVAVDECRIGLAGVYIEKGELEPALQYATAGHESAKKRGYPRHEATSSVTIGRIHLATGQAALALEHFRHSYRIAQGKNPFVEVEALAGIAVCSGTVEPAAEAVDLARRRGMRLYEAKALTALAQVLLGQGRLRDARETVGQAIEMHRQFGCVPGQKQAFAVVAPMKGK